MLATAAPGSKVPSTRSLVSKFQVSPVTVQQALQLLVTEGLVETHPGVGTFIREVNHAKTSDFSWQTSALGTARIKTAPTAMAMRMPVNDAIAMHVSYPDPELLPVRLVRSAIARVSRGDSAITRAPSPGLPELQSWFAHELAESTLPGLSAPSASDVIVIPGSQSGLGSVFRALASPGQAVIMESPTYWGAIAAAEQAGLRIVPIATGSSAPNINQLDRAFAESGARIFYAQPNFANPTGLQWTHAEADAILDVVRSHNAFLIEDDWAHDFGIDSVCKPIAGRDDSGHVIYIRSLTKSVSPAIRIAGMIARGPARDRILVDRTIEAMYVSSVLQSAALDILQHPAWRTHVNGLRHRLRERRDLLAKSLQEFAPQVHLTSLPVGGLNLWIQLNDSIDTTALSRRCEMRGLLIAPGDEWFPAESPGAFLRLNYSGPRPNSFVDGVKILSEELSA